MTTEQRALELVRQLRNDGINVASVVVEGRKIQIELAQKDAPPKIDGVQW